jgi:hypothetical protein
LPCCAATLTTSAMSLPCCCPVATLALSCGPCASLALILSVALMHLNNPTDPQQLCLARLFYKELLSWPALAASIISVGGVVWLSLLLPTAPWISPLIAITFAGYAAIKKSCKAAPPLIGVFIEMVCNQSSHILRSLTLLALLTPFTMLCLITLTALINLLNPFVLIVLLPTVGCVALTLITLMTLLNLITLTTVGCVPLLRGLPDLCGRGCVRTGGLHEHPAGGGGGIHLPTSVPVCRGGTCTHMHTHLHLPTLVSVC